MKSPAKYCIRFMWHFCSDQSSLIHQWQQFITSRNMAKFASEEKMLIQNHILVAILNSEAEYISALRQLADVSKLWWKTRSHVQSWKLIDVRCISQNFAPILSCKKTTKMFALTRIILKHHIVFKKALECCIRDWLQNEKIANVFITFLNSDAIVGNYKEYIDTFDTNLEVIKKKVESDAKAKRDYDECLKNVDGRLSFFALMVKPVQRFPHYILFLQVSSICYILIIHSL